jgi:alpha-beta hydrolase superfamily lysophospholipase
MLSKPVRDSVGVPPPELGAEVVAFPSASGSTIHGWFSPGRVNGGAVLLVHPLRGDRRVMLRRANFLHRQGYVVLLIDLQAHGESSGERITFGAREARDVEAAIAYLVKILPNEKRAVIGVSLGGVALILAKPPLPLNAVVLESVFPTIDDAIDDRLRLYLGKSGPVLRGFLTAQFKMGLGISTDELRPIAHIVEIRAPLLLMSGANDLHTTLPETIKLFEAASEPKELWIVEGAAHVDLHNFSPDSYEKKVSTFLALFIRNGA